MRMEKEIKELNEIGAKIMGWSKVQGTYKYIPYAGHIYERTGWWWCLDKEPIFWVEDWSPATKTDQAYQVATHLGHAFEVIMTDLKEFGCHIYIGEDGYFAGYTQEPALCIMRAVREVGL